jgi:hypothetical protein
MLKTVTSVAVFGTFLCVVVILGFILWRALFNPDDGDSRRSAEAPVAAAQNKSNSTDEAIAEYTKWLVVFTGLLVIATVFLYVSGERNVEVARESAKAAKKAVEVAESALILGQRAFI